MTQSEIENLQAQLAAAKEKMAGLVKHNAELDQRVASLTKERDDAKFQAASLRSDVSFHSLAMQHIANVLRMPSEKPGPDGKPVTTTMADLSGWVDQVAKKIAW